MSINDLMNSDSLIPTMMVIFVIIMIIAIPIGIANGKKANSNIYGYGENTGVLEEKMVKIVARRSMPHPASPTVMINMVVFEMEDGKRVELAIKDAITYGTMIEGDKGVLCYRGKQFIDFRRDLSDEI